MLPKTARGCKAGILWCKPAYLPRCMQSDAEAPAYTLRQVRGCSKDIGREADPDTVSVGVAPKSFNNLRFYCFMNFPRVT